MPSIVFTSSLIAAVVGLECFTGYSVMHGATIGSETKQCGKTTDSCYNASVHMGSMAKLQKAGCNSVLCQVNQDATRDGSFQFYENQCFDQTVAGKPVTFCCCNQGDRCNGGKMDSGSFLDRGLAMAKGLASILGK